jgi:hypothetical protein
VPLGFRIDGLDYLVTEEEAAAISDRLAHRHRGDLSHPAYSAQIMVDAMIEGEATDGEWHGTEKNELFGAIQDWLDEEGATVVSERVQNIRYGVFGERQDTARAYPPGLFHFVIDLGIAETDAVKHLDEPPVPGQAMTVDGRTIVVKSVTPATGGEYVATIRGVHHPG